VVSGLRPDPEQIPPQILHTIKHGAAEIAAEFLGNVAHRQNHVVRQLVCGWVVHRVLAVRVSKKLDRRLKTVDLPGGETVGRRLQTEEQKNVRGQRSEIEMLP
jgi:hypothetical protein